MMLVTGRTRSGPGRRGGASTSGRGWIAVRLATSVVLVAGCTSAGDDPPGAAEPSPTMSTTVPATVSVPTTVPATTGDRPVGLPSVTGELIINRQRDLIDRGLINVRVTNGSGADLIVTDRRLLAEHFDTPPAPERTSRIPAGRDINLQVPYGRAHDCASAEPVRAELRFSFSGDETPGTARIELGGTDILDTIRTEQCAQITLDDAFDLTFDEPTVDGEVLHVGLTLQATTTASPEIEIHSVDGTILVGAELADRPVRVAGPTTVLALDFGVNRCDPHAMAEVTKRFGLALRVALDGDAQVPVDVDVEPIVPHLERIVANCRAAATANG